MIPDQIPSAAVEALLAAAGLHDSWRLDALAGGGNNRVYRLETDGRSFVLKQYFYHPDDPRDRLGAEYAFAQLAWTHGVRALPAPLAADFDHKLALYSFVPGHRLEPDEIDEGAVEQALDFHLSVDHLREAPESRSLPAGSEACFRLSDHLATVERRVARLSRIEPLDPLCADAASFVSRQLAPAWARLAKRTIVNACELGVDLDEELSEDERAISPSDFGFHNALKAEDGTIRFLDFEYAGWDDPAKLVGDFFNQVAVPVPQNFYESFADRIAASRPRAELHRHRFDLLLPVYGIKWVCIMLNDFLPTGRRRRQFAGLDSDTAPRRAAQLDKARAALQALAL